MLEIIRGIRSKRNHGEARRRPADPLLESLITDLLGTTAGFLLTVVTVLLIAQNLLPN
jgi:hypothetical protein